VVEDHLLKAAEVRESVFRSREEKRLAVTILSGLLQEIQALQNATFAGAVLAEKDGYWG
jgi:hypothetical protein